MNIIKTMLSVCLSLALLLGSFPSNIEWNAYAEDTNQSDILEEIQNHDFVDITAIEFDSKTQEVQSVEDINVNSRSFNLADGTYLIDRGYGWVLGNDASFMDSGFAIPNEYLRMMKGKRVGTEHYIMTGTSTEFDFKVVKGAVEVTYEHTIETEMDLMMGFEMIAPEDENLYVKTYATYRRYDMIKIQNGRLASHSVTYEPNGTWAKYVTYRNGETVDQSALKEKVARSVLGQPESVDIKNSIQVSGYNRIKNVDILLNTSNKLIELSNRSNTKIHTGYGSQEYFSIELIDSKSNDIKASMTMTGNDYSNDPKYDSFDKTNYNIGDIIRISHKEPYLLSIKGPISGTTVSSSTVQEYIITETGLEVENSTVQPGIYNIMPKLRSSSLFTKDSSRDNVLLALNGNKYSTSSQWEFIYEASKRAYKIRNVATKKFLVDGYYSMVSPNALLAVNEPSDDSEYFKVKNFGNNEVSLINLKTNKAITWKSYGSSASLDSIMDLKPYTNSNEQKFILEIRK